MKFLYYLAALGEPNLEKKNETLSFNLICIHQNLNHSFDLMINYYDKNPSTLIYLKKIIDKLNFIDNFYLYIKKGILTELFLTNPDNKFIKNYDYILFILDDVKIMEININYMIDIKKKYNIKLLSPKVLNCTHKFMHKYEKNILTINNFLEVFMLLLTPENFFQFINLYTIDNKWMWGIDHLFGYFKIKAGVTNKCIANHLFTGGSNKKYANNLAKEYFKKKTSFKNLTEIRKKYKPIVKIINV